MKLIKSVHHTKDGKRYGHLTHLEGTDGRPACELKNRNFGNNSYPTNWILALGEQPICVVCSRRAKQLGEVCNG